MVLRSDDSYPNAFNLRRPCRTVSRNAMPLRTGRVLAKVTRTDAFQAHLDECTITIPSQYYIERGDTDI